MVIINDESNTAISTDNDDSGDELTESGKSFHPDTHNSHKQKDEKPNQQSKLNQNSNANAEDKPEDLLDMLALTFIRLCQYIKRTWLFVMNDLGGNLLIDRVIQWCVQHPQMAICIISIGFMAFLPILLFFAFVLSTIVMTLSGFLVLEGTILTVLTMIMCGLFGALTVVLLFFVLVGVATYIGVSRVYDMYDSTEVQRNLLRSFMQRKNTPSTSNENVARNSNQTSRSENVGNEN